jgi:glutaredoxin
MKRRKCPFCKKLKGLSDDKGYVWMEELEDKFVCPECDYMIKKN